MTRAATNPGTVPDDYIVKSLRVLAFEQSTGKCVSNKRYTAENGDVEEYTINIVRKATDSEPDNNPVEENGFTCTYDIDENNSIISGISVGSTASDV